MAATQTTVFLGEFETKTALELETRGPGTYYVKLMVRCNSLLSSVYIKANPGGGSVKANYFDTTTGDESSPERYNLTGHDPLAVAGVTNRVLVTKIHNKPILEVVVTGGSVEFGVYITAVSTTASDVDSSLIRDGDTFVYADNRALPAGTLGTDGKLYFLRSNMGVLSVDQDFGSPLVKRSAPALVTTQNATIDVVTASVVPPLKAWRLRRLNGQCRAFGFFEVFVDSLRVAKLFTGPASENAEFIFDPYDAAVAGQSVRVKYTQSFGPVVALSAVLFLTEANA